MGGGAEDIVSVASTDEINPYSDNIATSNDELSAYDDVAISNDEILKSDVNSIDNTLSEGSSKSYSNDSYDNLVIDEDGAVVFNCTIGTLTINGNNVTVRNNTISEINGTGADLKIYENTINGDITLTGNNNILNSNDISGKLNIGETGSTISSTIYDNTINGLSTIYGNGSVIYNNKFNARESEYSLNSNAENSLIYENTFAGTVSHRANNLTFRDNNVGGTLMIWTVSNIEIYNNYIKGDHYGSYPTVIVNSNKVNICNNILATSYLSLSGSNITVENNTINSLSGDPAIYLMSTNTIITGNTLYSSYAYGNDVIEDEDEDESNIIGENYPIKPTLTISAKDITVGNRLTVTTSVSIPDLPRNTVIQVIANGKIYNAKTKSSTGTAYISDLPAGEYTILAIFDGYGKYGKVTNSTTIKVSKLNPDLKLNVSDAIIGEDVNVSVSIAEATGNITLIIDGVENNIKLTPITIRETITDEWGFTEIQETMYGIANYTINNITEGNHTITAIYKGNEKLNVAYANKYFTLTKNDTNNIAVIVDGVEYPAEIVNGTITIKTNTPEQNNNVTIIVDGVEYPGEIVNGTVTIKTNTPAPNNNVTVIVDGVEYPAEIINGAVTIKTNTPAPNNNVTVIVDGVEYPAEIVNGTVTIKTNTPAPVDKNVTVVIDGVEYPGEIVNGTVTIKTNTPAPNNNVTVIVDGVEYPAEIINGTVTIKTNIPETNNNVTVIVDGVEYPAEIVNGTVTIKTNTPEPNNNVTVIVDGVEYPAEIVNGTVTIKTNTPAPADKNVSVVIDGVEYSGELVNGSVVIKNKVMTLVDSKLTIDPLTTVAENNGDLIVRLKDANGAGIENATIKVVFYSKTYTITTDVNGTAVLTIKYPHAGTYYATVYYSGDDKYKSSFKKCQVLVTKKASKLTAPKQTFKVNLKTKKVAVKLTSGKTALKYKKVTLKVNGRTYVATTSKKGYAIFKVTKLNKKGTYKYSVKFTGDKVYKAISNKGTIIVN